MSLKIKELLVMWAFMFTVTKGQPVDYNVTTLKEDIDKVKDEAQYQVNVIRSMYDDTISKQSHMQTEINTLNRKKVAMESKINSLNSKTSEMQAAINTLNTKKGEMQSEINTLQAQVRSLSESELPQVAFSAYMNTGHHYPSGGDTIPFCGVLLNKGNQYNPSTSTFTCPTTATYFFVFNIFSSAIKSGTNGERVEASRRRSNSNSQLAAVYCHNDNHCNIWLQCTNSAVIECLSGQQVWVQAWGDNNQMYSDYNAERSTFSGFILGK